ncbi:hypothetical protein Fmac_017408 [Flemingia macrophylla]|uniref:Protein kinase domain-containing protein n=1 Tax=Flemingia macrophylla TaxID=520843 RepID=A0ABD1M212_9FABA
MDTILSRIATGTILFLLLLLCLPFLSIAEDAIYRPIDLLSINCGSPYNFSTQDSRNWTGDIKFLYESHNSVVATPLTQPLQEGPYTHARLSHSQFSYSFPVTPGPKFLRLFFYSSSYKSSYETFDRSKANFTVKAGKFTLLQHFNASLNADAVNDPAQQGILYREYCISLENGERVNVTFIPSTTDSYAFINGIEIVSMPPYLYYTNSNVSNTELLPQFVGSSSQTYQIQNNSALETMYRLRAGDAEIPASGDTGMLRTWDVDSKYVTSQSVTSLDHAAGTKLKFTNTTPNYTAPDQVYRSVRSMGLNGTINTGFNLSWQFPIDNGFTYFLRLHFCELNPRVNPGYLKFYIYIEDHLVEDWADILSWSDEQKGVPVVKDYIVLIPGNQGKTYFSLKMHPHPNSSIKDATVNGIELFKINSSAGNLAGPNPDPPPQTPKDPLPSLKRKTSTGTVAAVAGSVSGVVLLSFIVALILIIKRNKNAAVDEGSNQKDGTSRGGGSSSLPTNLCRHFSIEEIRAATNNFDELFVVGTGGFGNVYKGYIDDGSTRVAVKRLKPGSQQGVQEFMNEIEMLSQLRHVHLVSLIGYCYEKNEMILVYDFMDRGTLRDHLYDTDNPSLSWKQRLQICIGAARGLHYLHAGAKHVIIHRDVKSTNILLDEKWVAKVSDFGLSRIGPTSSSVTHVSTQVKGSIGYLDPEYYKRQRLTEKSDVYSFGVVLLEVLSGRQPLLRTVEKRQMSLVDWAKHHYHKGSLREIVDQALKGQIAPECLRKFGEVALNCLLEDGTQRPSMKDIVGVLEFAMQLQYSVVNEVIESGEDYEDSEDMFSNSHSSLHGSDYSMNAGLNTTSSDSCGSKESDRIIRENVFSEIKDPKGR